MNLHLAIIGNQTPELQCSNVRRNAIQSYCNFITVRKEIFNYLRQQLKAVLFTISSCVLLLNNKKKFYTFPFKVYKVENQGGSWVACPVQTMVFLRLDGPNGPGLNLDHDRPNSD